MLQTFSYLSFGSVHNILHNFNKKDIKLGFRYQKKQFVFIPVVSFPGPYFILNLYETVSFS